MIYFTLYVRHDFVISDLNKLSESEKLEKENFDAKLEILNMCEKKFTDPGTVYDCIMFKDANVWKCCIDTSDNGDLSQCQLIGEYSKTHDFITLTNLDQLNVSMNVHDDGNTLELVGVCCKYLIIHYYLPYGRNL